MTCPFLSWKKTFHTYEKTEGVSKIVLLLLFINTYVYLVLANLLQIVRKLAHFISLHILETIFVIYSISFNFIDNKLHRPKLYKIGKIRLYFTKLFSTFSKKKSFKLLNLPAKKTNFKKLIINQRIKFSMKVLNFEEKGRIFYRTVEF